MKITDMPKERLEEGEDGLEGLKKEITHYPWPDDEKDLDEGLEKEILEAIKEAEEKAKEKKSTKDDDIQAENELKKTLAELDEEIRRAREEIRKARGEI